MSLFLGLYPCLVKEFLNTLGFAWSLGPLFYFIEMDFIFIPKKKKKKWILYCYTTELNFTYLSFNESLFTKAVFGCCKTFSGKYIFFRNANFRKRKMFPWCLVALQKIFRKILSGVWKRRRKTQIRKCRITQIRKIQATNPE